jgi:hypothetical protein
MMRFAAILFIGLAAPAGATEVAGRYLFEKVPEGYLRLDSVTGAVSLCAAREGIWHCTGVADDMAALTAENERLKGRVEELEKSRLAVRLPTNQDVDKLLDSFGKMVDKFIDLSRRIERRGTI